MNRFLTIARISAVCALACVLLMALKPEEEQEPVIEAKAETVEPVEILPDVVAVDPLEEEKAAMARTIYGEARGCTVEGQENVVWTILARYDHGGFGDTILDVITAPDQFYGYQKSNPVLDEHLAVAERIVNRWLDGDPGPGYLYFTGDGKENHFREERHG